jgi:hypothetical protein
MVSYFRICIYAFIGLLFSTITTQAHEHDITGTGQSSIGSHTHAKGNWMVGYRYKFTRTSGNKDGNDTINSSELMSQYGDVPLHMEMGMHMFEIMYGATDNLTLMVMPQYMTMRMTHASDHGGGHIHTHDVDGAGDTEVTGLYSFYKAQHGQTKHKVHATFGVSLPTGTTDAKFLNHHGEEYNLPYNMQFGTGTFDPIIGVTYSGTSPQWSWGTQTINYIRMGKNNEGYRQGNKYTANAWVSRNVTEFSALTTIAGADPKGQGGERIMASVGVNFTLGKKLANQTLGVEFGTPLYERFEGALPKTDYQVKAGWKVVF